MIIDKLIFEWDPVKAALNYTKLKVALELFRQEKQICLKLLNTEENNMRGLYDFSGGNKKSLCRQAQETDCNPS